MKEVKYYTFNQNNSGGYFVTSEENGIGETVIIEAPNYSEAYSKLQSIGEKVDGFNNYCECCGERWGDWEQDGYAVPSIFGKDITTEGAAGLFRTTAYVHYTDGTFKLFNLK